MKITQIIVEIWAHLFLWISLKLAELRYGHYYYFGVFRDAALNYHHTRFGDNCKIEMRAKLSTGGQDLAPSLRMGLHGKISDIIFYVKYERKL